MDIYSSGVGYVETLSVEPLSQYIPSQTVSLEDTTPLLNTHILSINDLEQYKTESIMARDRLVSIINDISSYRVLNHQYLPITREFIREIEARDFTDIERYKSLPKSFAFVMALNNKECRKMSDAEILSNFFGEEWDTWAEAPENIATFLEEHQTQIYANYEYMAYIVLNACDELAFSIQSLK